MTTNQPDRLDRVEAILTRLAEQQETFAERQEAFDARMDRLTERQEAFRQLVEQRDEQREREITYLFESINHLVELSQTQTQQAEQDRNQAAIDRQEFRTTIEAVLDVLRDRFTSNGH